LKKKYEAPEISIEEFELDNLCNFISGINDDNGGNGIE
jgi:hypothetical protein